MLIKSHFTETGFSEEASADMPWGSVLANGSADTGCLLPAAETDLLKGVLLHAHSYAAEQLADDASGVLPDQLLNVMRQGRCYVTCEGAVTDGAGAYVRYAGSGEKGAVLATHTPGETIDARQWITFRSTTSGSGICEIEVKF
jgi:hypothetical protein